MKTRVPQRTISILTAALCITPFLFTDGAPPPAAASGPEPIKVTIPATTSSRSPVKISPVTMGQRVTVKITHAMWKGGGTKAGRATDWQGYRGRLEMNGLPWMALVFAVGKQNILPDKREFTFDVPADGDLVAFANDRNPDGNTGEVNMIVTISPK